MSMTLDDHDVIARFRAGDDAIFAEVVAEYRAELLRHAGRSVGDAATAEDLVQETFVRAYRAFARLPDDSRIRPWLHQILRNVCVDDAHRRRRDAHKTERAGSQAPRSAVADGPEDVLGLDRDTTALAEALAGLPEAHRDAFVQRVVVGLEYDEIAAREGVSETNARARVSRARSALRKALQGAAAIPIACYLVLRRPGRSAMAAPPDAAGGAVTSAAASPAAVDTAGRLATNVAPMMEAATNLATSASHSVPLLTKAALGIGAVATVSFATAPERPPLVPPTVTVEAAGADVDEPLLGAVDVSPAVSAVEPAGARFEAGAVTEPAIAVPDPVDEATDDLSVPTDPVDEADTAVAAEDDPLPIAGAEAPSATPTTVPPAAPTTSLPVESVLPSLGGSLVASVSISPAGPRLDLAGTVAFSVDATFDGTLSGRIAVDEPDPDGVSRIDGVLTLVFDTGTIELRLAGRGVVDDAENTLPLTIAGQYRATGDLGQLAPSGSFSGLLSDGAFTLTLVG